MDNILMELENTLTKKFINVDIHNYSHGDFQELFYLIEETVNISFTTCSYAIANTSINSGHIHIIVKEIGNQHTLNNKLSVLLSVQDFIVQHIEVSLLS